MPPMRQLFVGQRRRVRLTYEARRKGVSSGEGKSDEAVHAAAEARRFRET